MLKIQMEEEMKRKIWLALTLCLTILLIACSQAEVDQPVQSNESNEENELTTGNLPTTDRAGNEISIPEEINRIISMSPGNTEILIELGFGDKIIAADTYSEDVEGLPEGIPLFDMMTPDAEQIIALEPDIIYTTGMSMVGGNDPYKPISDLGICVTYIPASDSIEGIYEDIMFFAKSLHVEDLGMEIVDNMKSQIKKFQEIGATIEDKRTVYFEIAAAPSIVSFGNGVFLNEMIEIIGAKNILSDHSMWISVSEETIISSDPDVIITSVDYIEDPVGEIKSRSGWENMTAVKNDKVYWVDNNVTSHSNHKIIEGLKQIAEAIYPEIY